MIYPKENNYKEEYMISLFLRFKVQFDTAMSQKNIQ